MPQFKYTNNNISQNIHSQSNFNTIQNIILLCNIPHLTTISAFSISNLVYLVIIYFYPLFELISCYQQTCTNHVEYNMQSVLGRYNLNLGAAQFTTERTEILNVLFTRNPLTNFAFEKESSLLISKPDQSLNYKHSRLITGNTTQNLCILFGNVSN